MHAATPDKGHPQIQEDLFERLVISSPVLNSDLNNEKNDKAGAMSLTMGTFKHLPDKKLEQAGIQKGQALNKEKVKNNCEPNVNRRNKDKISDKQKYNCDQNMDAKEKDLSLEQSKKCHIEQKPFPNFKSFSIEEEEGSGGYGTVYRARRKADGVTFAIKCPHVNANMNHVRNELKMLE